MKTPFVTKDQLEAIAAQYPLSLIQSDAADE